MSENDLSTEKKILNEKRKSIKQEIILKKKNMQDAFNKYRSLSKEAKGSYSEDKETSEKIYNMLSKDIDVYEEAMKKPYFGRVDFREYMNEEEQIYIGKKGINSSKDGQEIVVDWRAPVADLYYSSTGGEAFYKAPAGIIEGKLNLKRKFLFKDDEIDRIFDEGINEIIVNNEEGNALVDEYLKINLEENTGKKLKEVVATIQKEQNDIIRWPKNIPLIVQGSAGSGKTTIALHRLAYLLYRHKDTIGGKDILVLAPNRLFLNYISDILPSLGANEVNQLTFEELIINKLKLKGKIYSKDKKLSKIIEEDDENKKRLIIESSKIKGTLLFKSMLERYISLTIGSALDIDDIKIEGEILFSKKEILRLYLKDLKNYPINKRKDEIKRYLSLKLKSQVQRIMVSVDNKWNPQIIAIKKEMEDSKERREKLIEVYEKRDKLKDTIKNNSRKIFNNYFKAWRSISSKDIYHNFFNDEDIFLIATDNKISKELSNYMREEHNNNCLNNIIDEDDLPPLAYIRNLIEGIEEKEKFSHIVVDEAQDYSPFQIYIVNEFTRNNSLTLVGDIAQGIYYYKGLKNWNGITEKIFDGNASYIVLSQSYRSTVEIIDFANKSLLSQNLGIKSARPVLRHGKKPKIINLEHDEDYKDVVDNIIDEINNLDKSTVAIINRDVKEAKEVYNHLKRRSKYKFDIVTDVTLKSKEVKSNYIIIPSYLTKGLEFDCSIIYDPSKDNYGDNILDKRLLYVSLTRALHLEYVICPFNFEKSKFI